MQIAVLMSFVVICCFSQGAIIKKEKVFFHLSPRRSNRRVKAARAKQDFIHNQICFLHRSVLSRRFVFVSLTVEKTLFSVKMCMKLQKLEFMRVLP